MSYKQYHKDLQIFRSSRPEVFCKKGIQRNFTKFTGKHLCQRLFFNKVAGLRPATLLKKSLWHRCFPVNFAKFLRTPFYKENLWWRLLIKYWEIKLILQYYKQGNMSFQKFKSKCPDCMCQPYESSLIKGESRIEFRTHCVIITQTR